uniref:RWP-RK domain-containing protein n=1 Tax=Cucumis melo TaxID=3656 RepID=A0A9I9DCL4_CUCME
MPHLMPPMLTPVASSTKSDSYCYRDANSSHAATSDAAQDFFSKGNNSGNKRRKGSFVLGLEEIRKYFHIPISEAAKEINIGLTVLKRRCRQLNIMRWPHRKHKSLNSLIQNVKEMRLTNEVKGLEEHKRLLEEMPNMDLTHTIKRLRQACFKANYKKNRRLRSNNIASLHH